MTTSRNDAAIWATSAGNKFREVARTSENPTTKALAEGLAHLAEAVRSLEARTPAATPPPNPIDP